jgi:uncharacterized protein YcbX
MRQRFHANLEIAGYPAFWEDRLFGARSETVTFRVGAAKLIGTNLCKRCVVPACGQSGGGDTLAFDFMLRSTASRGGCRF